GEFRGDPAGRRELRDAASHHPGADDPDPPHVPSPALRVAGVLRRALRHAASSVRDRGTIVGAARPPGGGGAFEDQSSRSSSPLRSSRSSSSPLRSSRSPSRSSRSSSSPSRFPSSPSSPP